MSYCCCCQTLSCCSPPGLTSFAPDPLPLMGASYKMADSFLSLCLLTCVDLCCCCSWDWNTLSSEVHVSCGFDHCVLCILPFFLLHSIAVAFFKYVVPKNLWVWSVVGPNSMASKYMSELMNVEWDHCWKRGWRRYIDGKMKPTHSAFSLPVCELFLWNHCGHQFSVPCTWFYYHCTSQWFFFSSLPLRLLAGISIKFQVGLME